MKTNVSIEYPFKQTSRHIKDKFLALAILYGGQVDIINLVDRTKFSCKLTAHQGSTSVSLETYPFDT